MNNICKIFAAVLAAALFFGTGCEAFYEAINGEQPAGSRAEPDPNSDNYQPRYVIGIFTLVEYPRASALEREITAFDGRSVWINTNQSFSSKHLCDARVVARPGNPDRCDLQFKLDRMGKVQWQVFAGGNRDTPVVLVVDSRYAAKFIPELADDDSDSDWVTLRVGIDAPTAKGIARFAKKNYLYYNPDTKSWFDF